MQQSSKVTGLVEWVSPFVNITGILVLVLLWINFLYGPWPWTWDLLFVRSGGPLLYGQHILSEVAVLIVATFFTIKYPKEAYRWVAVVFAGAAIHELLVGLNIIIDFNFSVNAYLGIVDPRWPLDLTVILAAGIVVSTKWQKRILMEIFLIAAVYEIAWNLLVRVFSFSAISMVGFQPGPAFWDWKENSLEVVSWILPSAWWIWRWRHSQPLQP